MQVTYQLPGEQNGELNIYDVTGRKVKKYILNSESNKLQINNAELKDGVYLYNVSVNGEVVFSDKLVIIK